jgi:hypothetical protein
MAARLGNVLYWLGCIVAVGWVAACLLVTPAGGNWGGVWFVAAWAVIPLGAEWTLRYILAGPPIKQPQ